ncbi:MAG: KH domain-containing protein [Synergistaceae bacterium]|jgi:spoIIIJ-associated protein|nr:KH domain-containing protein [Synergistaceae bacterium]
MDSLSGRERTATIEAMPVETITLDAPSIAAAKTTVSALWNVSEDDLVVTVLDEEKRLFGLLGKKMKLRVVTRAPLMYLQSRDFARAVLEQSELDLNATLNEEYTINLDGEDSAIVIGRHGETLKALEFLTNLIYRTDQGTPKIRFDCGGYRQRREESLIRLAESVAREVTHKHSAITLEPMSSWERRIIHLALQDNNEVSTSSEGEEPNRKIVVYPCGYTKHRQNFRRRRRSKE